MLKKLTKVLSLLLILCLMVSMFPAVALADEGTEAPVVTETPEETTPVVTPVPEESSAPVESPVPSETPAVEASPAPSDTPVDNTSAAGDEPASDESGDYSLTNPDEGVAATSLTMGTKPANGTTTGNPFVKGTGGSNSFRIPAMVTLSNGTLVAAADARWNTTYDGGGLDTIVSYSSDKGANWNYTFANYLGDNGNVYNGSGSTAFIDPALATDGSTVYMLCDLYPYGVALNGSGNTAPSTAVGFNSDGKLLLSTNGSNYNYYLDGTVIKDSIGNEVSGLTVDSYFNVTGTYNNTSYNTNLFFSDSPFKVVRTGYLYLTKSTDGGKTWSTPTLIPNVKTSSEQVCLVGPGRGLVTYVNNVKTIVFPVYSYNGSSESQRMGFIYSSNNGASWTRVDSSISWSSEAAVVALKDGTLRFFYRNGTSALCYADYSWTTNSWGDAVNTGIATNSNTQISAISYSKTVGGQQVILVSCPTGSGNSGSSSSSASARLNGKIFVGLVNSGNTMDWSTGTSVSLTSQHSSTNYFMYSCLTELSDGSVAILYEDNESAWGTGDGYYYQMTYATVAASSFGLTFDSGSSGEGEGEENNDPVTVTDDTSSVSATAKGLTSVLAEKQANATPYTGYTAAVTYSITLNDGAYTDSADIKIPYDSAFDGCNNFIGSVPNADDTISTFSVDLKDGFFVGTAPHFSDVTISGRTVTQEENVTLVVGETSTTFTEAGNYSNNYTAPNASIATIKIEGQDAQEGGVEYKQASVTCNDLISSNQTSWTAASGYYYTPDGTNYYPVYAKRSSAKKGSLWWQYTQYTYTWGYKIGDSEPTQIGNTQVEGSSSDDGRDATPNIIVYTQSTTAAIPASTSFSFTGVSAGTTIAVVGSTQYNITVNRKQKNVDLSIGGSITFEDAKAGTVEVGNSAVVEASLTDGVLSITGLTEGTTTVTTNTTVYNVTVKEVPPVVDIDTTPFISGTGDYSGNKVTKLTTSVNKVYDLNLNISGSNIVWSSADESIATVDQNGKITAIAEGETTITCTVDGVAYTIPVVVLYNETYLSNGSYDYLCDLYIAEVTNTTVKYSINLDTNLLDAQEGEAIYLGFDYAFCIDFFGMQDDGHALTFMAATGSKGEYYSLYEVDDVTSLDVYKNGAMHWQAVEMEDGANRVQTLLKSVISAGYNGATGFTRTQNNGSISSSLTFRSQKLPTVEKTIVSVNDVPYTEGMTATAGDQIVYDVTITQYETTEAINYSSVTLKDNLSGAKFTSYNSDSVVPSLSNSTLTSNKTYSYEVTYTLTADDLDTDIINTVELKYDYKAEYSSGTFGGSAKAEAKISAPTFVPKDIVIDFGLPVTIDYSASDAHGRYNLESGSATYGDVDVTDNIVTYTPTETLKGIDTVTLRNVKGAEYTFKVYPATTVYYEEGFATYTGSWGNTASKGTGAQTAQIAGQSTDEYGYDAKYAGEGAGPSNGSQATSTTITDAATFSFTGTGVDIYANCTEASGAVNVVIRDSNEALVKLLIIDTKTGTGSSDATAGQNVNSYSLPIASVTGLTHGTYNVTVRHSKLTADDTGKPVSLDGFRVYGTLKDQNNSVYTADLEDNPTYIELRNEVLEALDVTTISNSQYANQVASDIMKQVYDGADTSEDVETTVSALVLSGDATLNAQDLLDNGPKNEIFLRNGDSLVFKVTTGREVQIGLKAVDKGTTYTITGKTGDQSITSSTDMFYTVFSKGDATNGQTITIKNTGEGILSITKLKICDDPGATLGELTEEDLIPALVGMGYELEPEEPVVEYADATLTVVVNDATTTLIQNGVKGETATFTAEDIEAAAQSLVPEGYELKGQAEAVSVVYGESDTVTFSAEEIPTEPEEPEQPTEPEEPEQPSKPANIISAVIRLFDKIFGSLKGLFR